jgi:Zn-dependent peptidase ImmA (M78 family)/DNA-binding XRE family transcriptional regulator
MISKNITYYRLKKGLTQKELSEAVGVTPMAISNYEKGLRMPDLTMSRKLADALDTNLAGLMAAGNEEHQFVHCEFRKMARFSKSNQEYVRSSVETYLGRFFMVTDRLGQAVLREAPMCHVLEPTLDAEKDAQQLREWLGFASEGPIPNLVGALENKGVLIYLFEYDNDQFSGMNGTVDGRPYIMVNSKMTAERQRSTLVHELAHVFFKVPEKEDAAWEKHMTAVSGAFLFPREDAFNELGVRRYAVSGDMVMVAEEYGISLQMLAKRAHVLKILDDAAYRAFNIQVNKIGWRKNEPERIPKEKTNLFRQLVLRAVSEEEISISKGAELLQVPVFEIRQMLSVEGAF